MTPEDLKNQLREAQVVVDSDTVERWLAVVVRSGRLKSTVNDLLDRVRMTHGLSVPDARERFRKAVATDEGPAIDPRAHQLISVLAGCQLLQLFEGKSRTATALESIDAAALSVRCIGRSGAALALPDIADAADVWLGRRAESVREIRFTRMKRQSVVPIGSLQFETGDVAGIQAAVNRVSTWAENVQSTLTEAIDRTDELVGELRGASMVADEQQRMLWWIASRPVEGDGWLPAVCVAKELADLTALSPGPSSAKQLLARRLASADATLPDAPQREQLTGHIATGLADVAPVSSWLASGGEPRPRVRSVADAALAVYEELMLKRVAGEDHG